MTACKDAGVGSRGRNANVCAGKVGPNGLCHFHASMRAFEEALRDIEGKQGGAEDSRAMTDDQQTVVSLEAVRNEPQQQVIEILREMLVMARSGKLRSISIQARVLDDDGEIAIHETWGGDMTFRDACDQIRQHEFNLRCRTFLNAYHTSEYIADPPPDESEQENNEDPE